MRSLPATLTSAQKAGGKVLCKIMVSDGASFYTYGLETTDRLYSVEHIEREWSQKAEVVINDVSNTISALDLRGFSSTLYYGYNTAISRSAWVKNTAYVIDNVVRPTTATGYQYRCIVAGTSHATTEPTWSTVIGATQTDGTVRWIAEVYGDEYSACAPLTVISQRKDTAPGSLKTTLSSIGLFDKLEYDRSSDAFNPDEGYASAIDSIINFVLVPSTWGAHYTHCVDYIPTFDSKDTVLDTFAPKDSFQVFFNESRLSVLKKLLNWTACKARVERNTTTGVAEIHIFDPDDQVTHYTTGTTYDYEYNDAVTNHNFFAKSTRQRAIMPNYIVVSSHPTYGASISSYKEDQDSTSVIGEFRDHHYARVANETECTNIATGILLHHQMAGEKGYGYAPMNCGQEVFDYVKITDSWANDTRIGNIGYIYRRYKFE